jgi:hypothetical protein
MTEFERRLANLRPAVVDRDALLYTAGRASAPTPRWWKRACLALAVGQAGTLGLWLAPVRPATPPPAVVTPDPPPPDPSSYLALLRTWDQPAPPSGGGETPSRPPLTAGSRSF